MNQTIIDHSELKDDEIFNNEHILVTNNKQTYKIWKKLENGDKLKYLITCSNWSQVQSAMVSFLPKPTFKRKRKPRKS